MTGIINDTPMKLLDRFIFSRLTDGQRIGKSVHVQIHVAIFFIIKYLSDVTASVDKSVCASAKSDLSLNNGIPTKKWRMRRVLCISIFTHMA